MSRESFVYIMPVFSHLIDDDIHKRHPSCGRMRMGVLADFLENLGILVRYALGLDYVGSEALSAIHSMRSRMD